jgi:hypothetical protein
MEKISGRDAKGNERGHGVKGGIELLFGNSRRWG